MIINFVGNFQTGYVGEVADQVHLAREMEGLGHTVRRVPQDIWKSYCEGAININWASQLPIKADINLITKWHHFNDGSFIDRLRIVSEAPVFYWVWDAMRGEEWHLNMVFASDLYLGNDVRSSMYPIEAKDKLYYFPFDVADGNLPWMTTPEEEKKYDVVFFGSCLEQGDRIEYLTAINKTTPVKIFAWNYKDWINLGFDAEPACYGFDFVQAVGDSRIILGFSVEPNCWGYWSNRVGKALSLQGFLLYQYAPGMELFLRDGCEYFSSIDEAREKIDHYLIAVEERNRIAKRGREIGRDRFTSEARVKDLMILIERYLKKGDKKWDF